MLPRRVLVILVIAMRLAGQQDVPGVVIIIVPLCAILAARPFLARIKQAGDIVVVLEHEMNMPPGLVGELAGRLAQRMQHRDFARLGDRVNGVQP